MRNTIVGLILLLTVSPVWGQAGIGGALVSVTDEKYQPLLGVNVYAADGFGGTTDMDGKIRIPTDKLQRVFEFSYLGYETQRWTFMQLRKKGYKVRLAPSAQIIKEVVVVGRTDARKEEIPYQVEKISSEEIAFNNSATTAHSLESSGQVFVQRSQAGGGSPVLRGFEANKVLLVVDGTRMNNAIYRSGHLQNSITIDNSALENIEVIFGPGSLMYGSDALGGVIHFRTKRPPILTQDDPAYQKTSAAGYVRFATANKEKTAHINFMHARHKMGMFSSITYSDFGDLRTGAKRLPDYPDFGKRLYYVEVIDGADQVIENYDPNIIPKSGYWQFDALNKIRFLPAQHLELGVNLQVSTSSNIPRNDKLAIEKGDPQRLKFAEWYYGPQLRFLTSGHLKWFGTKWFATKAKVIAAYQRINEDRYQRKFGKVRRTFRLEDVHVYSVTADLEKKLNKKGNFKFLYGTEYNLNNVFSKAGKLDITTNFVTGGALTRYPNGSSKMESYGSYGILQAGSRDSVFNASAGLRYSDIRLNAKYVKEDIFTWPREFYDGLENHNNALTWGFGATLNTHSGFQLRGLISTAFRAPNLDDFGKIRAKYGYITVPNPGVKPEHSLQKEVTIGQFFRKRAYYASHRHGFAANIYVTAYSTLVRDAIVVDTFPAPDGSNFIELEPGELLRTTASINADTAQIKGLSANARFYFGPHWTLAGSWSIVKGVSISNGQEGPLAHIPPPYGKAELSFENKKIKLSAVIRYNGFKPIDEFGPGTADNAKTAYDIGSPAWHTYNIYSTFNLGKDYSLQFAIENIADLHYRPFSSGISAPGRNLIFSLRKSL